MRQPMLTRIGQAKFIDQHDGSCTGLICDCIDGYCPCFYDCDNGGSIVTSAKVFIMLYDSYNKGIENG
jgi:hypothetical protein